MGFGLLGRNQVNHAQAVSLTTDNGLREGNTATSFLGTYTTQVDTVSNSDGTYTLNFGVYNRSSWESATRLRKAAQPGGPHQGIIPSKPQGQGIHLGGDLDEYWYWSEVIKP